jgi:hypothetical protein
MAQARTTPGLIVDSLTVDGEDLGTHLLCIEASFYDHGWEEVCRHEQYAVLQALYTTNSMPQHGYTWTMTLRVTPAQFNAMLAQLHPVFMTRRLASWMIRFAQSDIPQTFAGTLMALRPASTVCGPEITLSIWTPTAFSLPPSPQ